MQMSSDLRKAFIVGAVITVASVAASFIPVWIWLQIDPVVDHASIYISCIVLPGTIAPTCSFFLLRAQMRAEKLARENDRLANSDLLTGLPNRRAFFAAAETLRTRAKFGGGVLVCAIADLDHFKRINDEFGHDAGDAVLKSVGGVLLETAPAGGIAARLGGEEFALAGLFESKAAAKAAFAHVVASVAGSACDHGGTQLVVTLSLGFAAAEPGESISTLMSRADRALYEAKRTGRNRALSADEAPEPLRAAAPHVRRARG